MAELNLDNFGNALGGMIDARHSRYIIGQVNRCFEAIDKVMGGEATLIYAANRILRAEEIMKSLQNDQGFSYSTTADELIVSKIVSRTLETYPIEVI